MESDPDPGERPLRLNVPSRAEVTAYTESARAQFGVLWGGLKGIASAIDKALPRATEFLQASKAHPKGDWRFLFDLLDSSTGIWLAIAIEAQTRTRGSDEAVTAILRRGLTNPQLLDESAESVQRSALGPPKRKQLIAGIEHVRSRDFELAVPLLMNPLEGAFWLLAEERGLIRRNSKGKWVVAVPYKDAGRPIRGLEQLLTSVDLEMPPELVRFAKVLSYGTRGNEFRHGTAVEGWELRALVLLVTLLGWLDAQGLIDAQESVHRAFVPKAAAVSDSRSE